MERKVVIPLISIIIISSLILLYTALTTKVIEDIKPVMKEEKEKILVTYFSRNKENYGVGNVEIGNTKVLANYIIDYLDTDFYEITPLNAYPDSYQETLDIAKKEQSENVRPQIIDRIDNFDKYTTIFIGYPIWFGDMPMIIYTFLDSYDFTNKKIYLFNTHEGSNDSGTYEKIEKKLVNSNVIKNGFNIKGTLVRDVSTKEKVTNWLKELGY